jgi:hypothetical protein
MTLAVCGQIHASNEHIDIQTVVTHMNNLRLFVQEGYGSMDGFTQRRHGSSAYYICHHRTGDHEPVVFYASHEALEMFKRYKKPYSTPRYAHDVSVTFKSLNACPYEDNSDNASGGQVESDSSDTEYSSDEYHDIESEENDNEDNASDVSTDY